VAATLEHTASALNDQADHVAGAAHSAAGKLKVTADYIRGNDVRAIFFSVSAVRRGRRLRHRPVVRPRVRTA
jgi:hypothetical protein